MFDNSIIWFFVKYAYGPWDENFHCAIMAQNIFNVWEKRREEYIEKYKSSNLADKSMYVAEMISGDDAKILSKWLFNHETWRTTNFPTYEEKV